MVEELETLSASLYTVQSSSSGISLARDGLRPLDLESCGGTMLGPDQWRESRDSSVEKDTRGNDRVPRQKFGWGGQRQRRGRRRFNSQGDGRDCSAVRGEEQGWEWDGLGDAVHGVVCHLGVHKQGWMWSHSEQGIAAMHLLDGMPLVRTGSIIVGGLSVVCKADLLPGQ